MGHSVDGFEGAAPLPGPTYCGSLRPFPSAEATHSDTRCYDLRGIATYRVASAGRPSDVPADVPCVGEKVASHNVL